MLEVALITAHDTHLSFPHQVETVFAMATTHAAPVLRIADFVAAETLTEQHLFRGGAT